LAQSLNPAAMAVCGSLEQGSGWLRLTAAIT
jgi:hypothetical protein